MTQIAWDPPAAPAIKWDDDPAPAVQPAKIAWDSPPAGAGGIAWDAPTAVHEVAQPASAFNKAIQGDQRGMMARIEDSNKAMSAAPNDFTINPVKQFRQATGRLAAGFNALKTQPAAPLEQLYAMATQEPSDEHFGQVADEMVKRVSASRGMLPTIGSYTGGPALPEFSPQILSATEIAKKGWGNLTPDEKQQFHKLMLPAVGYAPQPSTPAMQTESTQLGTGGAAAEAFGRGVSGTGQLLGININDPDPNVAREQQGVAARASQEHPIVSTAAGFTGSMLDPGMRAGGAAVGKAIAPVIGETRGLVGAVDAAREAGKSVPMAVGTELFQSGVNNAAFGGGITAADQVLHGQVDPDAIMKETLKQGALGPVFHSTLGVVAEKWGQARAEHAAVGAIADKYNVDVDAARKILADLRANQASIEQGRREIAGIKWDQPEKANAENTSAPTVTQPDNGVQQPVVDNTARQTPPRPPAAVPPADQLAGSQQSPVPLRPSPYDGPPQRPAPSPYEQPPQRPAPSPYEGTPQAPAAARPPVEAWNTTPTGPQLAGIRRGPVEQPAATEQQIAAEPTAPQHTKESLQSLPPGSVARIAFGMGIRPKAKADNIAAILERQAARENPDLQQQSGATRAENTAGAKPAPLVAPTENPNAPTVEVNKPRTPAAEPRKSSAADSLLRHGVDDGLFPNDFERNSDSAAAIHPDAVEGMNPSQKQTLRGVVDENRASDATAGMSAQQRERYEAGVVARYGANKDQRLAEAIEHYKNSPDANLRKLAAYADAEGTGPKVTKPVESFNHGDEFDLGKRHFRVEIDEEGNTHFIDTDIEIPYAEGTKKYNAGSLKKAPTMEDTEFAPPEEKKTTGAQGSLLGERHEGSTVGSKSGSMFGDVSKGPANAIEDTRKPVSDAETMSMFEPKDRKPGGGGTTPNVGTAPTKSTAKPTAAEATNGFARTLQWLRKTFAPQTASPDARKTGDLVRASLGELARHEEQAQTALKNARWYFDGQDKSVGQDFIDRFQAGEKQPTPELQAMANTWEKINRAQTDRLDALDPEIKRQWEEHHIKQVWKETASDPGKVEQIVAKLISKRPLEGSKGFLKKKSYLTYKEGRDAGLTPLYDNPVDAMMHGFHEAEQFIQMRKVANTLIHGGLASYVRAGAQVPEGKAIVDDPAFHVFAPPTISVNEYVNKSVHDALQRVADKLGIRVKTVPSDDGLSRGALGTAYGDKLAIRKFGTDIGVLAHEIGHTIDHRYDLQSQFMKPKYAEDMRAIADMMEPETPGAKSYTRRADEKMAEMMDAYLNAPQTMRDRAPTVFRDFQDFLGSHDELLPLAELERTLALKKLTTEIPRGGITKMGSYALPKEMADVLANHLSRGFGGNGLFRGYMTVNNVMNSVQLAGAFHAGFTSLDSAISRDALAVEQLANGRPLAAVKSWLSAPVAPVTNAYHGHQLISEYLKPGTHPELGPVVQALVEGGARLHQNSALQSKMLEGMTRAFRKGNYFEGIAKIPGAALDAINVPIMEKLVPMQKWGVMGDLMHEELQRLGPDATADQIRASARKVVDATDNRMGQVVYDNLFLNRKAKDLLMASMRSVGWNMGTVKEVGGGIAQMLSPRNAASVATGKGFSGHAAPYVMAMLTRTALAGALYMYFKTGQYPQTLQDFYQPKTGRKDEEGNDIRVQLPSYMRDVVAMGHGVDMKHPGKLLGNLTDMATSKLAPLPAALLELARNKDYFGTQIANPDESLAQKTLDRGKFLAKQAMPFNVQSMQRQGENVPTDERVGAMVGLTPTPKRFIETPAQETAGEISQQKYGGLTRTPDQAQKGQLKNNLAKQLKASPETGQKAIDQALADKKIGSKDAEEIEKKAGMSGLAWHLKSFTPEEAVKVWGQANDAERKEIEPIVRDKILNSKHTDAEQDQMLAGAGIKPPEDLAITREHQDLNQKAAAEEKRKQQAESLIRRIDVLDRQGDLKGAAPLRVELGRLRDQPPAITPRERSRLQLLRAYVQRKNEVDQRVKEGSLPAQSGAAIIKDARRRVS